LIEVAGFWPKKKAPLISPFAIAWKLAMKE
jgi:hypothetical protein